MLTNGLDIAYEEEDDGFTFTRKSRATTRNAKVAVPEPPPKEPTPPPVLTPPRQAKARAPKVKPVTTKHQQPPSPQLLPKQALRQAKRQQDENVHNHHYPNHQNVQPVRVPKAWGFEQSMEDAGLNPVSPPPPASPVRHGRRTISEGAKVVIPLLDTPIIQRNKQFRKETGGEGGSNSRRSSLGLRGRRASSLIDNGQVGTLEFNFVGTGDLRVNR